MLKKITGKIEALERQKNKKEEQLKVLQADITKIDEDLKPLYNLKKQYEKLEASANELLEG